MVMTINRCIEYTKASQGVKLAAKFEAFNLAEALDLPLSCMRNIQQRVRIGVEPIGVSHSVAVAAAASDPSVPPVPQTPLCLFIVTDKQWLQENVLCLLSNAVKYSSEGSVVVSLFLERETVSASTGASRLSVGLSPRTSYSIPSSPSPPSSPTLPPRPPSSALELPESLASVSPTHNIVAIERVSSTANGLSLSPSDTETENDGVVGAKSNSNGHRVAFTGLGGFEQVSEKVSEPVPPPRPVPPLPTSSSHQPLRESLTRSMTRRDSGRESVRESVREKMFIRVEVSDTGIGVPPHLKDTLFRPFNQTQKMAGGTGLGLYSLAKRVDALQGRYGVRDRDDGQHGSVFWFTIPYKPDELTAAEYEKDLASTPPTQLAQQSVNSFDSLYATYHLRPASLHSQASGSLSLRSSELSTMMLRKQASRAISYAAINHDAMDILIADDTPSIVKMTAMMLKRLGHRVTSAENGEVALKMVQKQFAKYGVPYDLVLMDLQMPVMDGLEATRRIRSHQKELLEKNGQGQSFYQLVVGMSANEDDETREIAMSAGMDHFVGKPFKAEVFDSIVKTLFDVATAAPVQSQSEGDPTEGIVREQSGHMMNLSGIAEDSFGSSLMTTSSRAISTLIEDEVKTTTSS